MKQSYEKYIITDGFFTMFMGSFDFDCPNLTSDPSHSKKYFRIEDAQKDIDKIVEKFGIRYKDEYKVTKLSIIFEDV